MLRLINRLRLKLKGGVWTIKPQGLPKGRTLISYTTLPFMSGNGALSAHTNRWECKEIANTFLNRGYVVDVIDWDRPFIPKTRYDFLIDVRPDMERLAEKLNNDCYKVFHATGAHWDFQNRAEIRRIADIEMRRGKKLTPRRLQREGHSAETADIITSLGNDFTISTYAFAKKDIVRIPISTTRLFPSPESKNFETARNSFVWIGGAGMAHKGLDLVLEAFSGMPELSLTVFGKGDSDFMDVYKKELFETANIKYEGYVDIGSERFSKVVEASLALVFPSCSEGGGGSAIECMHAGLIPIVSREASVDVEDFGIILRENTIEEIRAQAQHLASLPTEALKRSAIKAWEYARKRHTRESFSLAFRSFVERIEQERYHKSHEM